MEHPVHVITRQARAGGPAPRPPEAIPANTNRIREACDSPPGLFNQEVQSKVRSSPSLRPYLFALVVPVVMLMAAGSVWLLRTAETDRHLAVGSKCVVRHSRS